MFIPRRDFLLLGGAMLFAGSQLRRALAGNTPVVNADADRVAIKGYDPVAYFTEGKPVQGSSEFESEWQGARWRFSSAAHRDLFSKKPDAYAPLFGGFCAMGMAEGGKYPIDPEAWAIVDGKLYLNSDAAALAEWKHDVNGNIQKAEANWRNLSQ